MKLARFSPLSALLPVCLALLSAGAQTTAPTTAVGSTSSVQPVTVKMRAAGTIGSINVLTQGSPNLDFKLSTGGTCAVGTAYTAGQTCTVKFTFSPTHPGIRYGAIDIYNNASPASSIGTAFAQGTGNGPQASFTPPSQKAIAGNNGDPDYVVAVDGAADVFVNGMGYKGVEEFVASSGYETVKKFGTEANYSLGIAVDSAGNVFFTDIDNGLVKEALAASGYSNIVTIASGFYLPRGLAVDSIGNVFVADTYHNAVKELVAASGYSTVNVLGSGFNLPVALAVDVSGNVFVSDAGSHRVLEILKASGYLTVQQVGPVFSTPANGLCCDPNGIVLDGEGDLFVSELSSSGIRSIGEIVAQGGYTVIKTVHTNSHSADVTGLAIDGGGNIYANDSGGLTKLSFGDPPAYTFAATEEGKTSTDSPLTVTVSNGGNEDLHISSLSYPPDFPEASGADCTSSTDLTAGNSCALKIDFSPLVSSATGTSTSLHEKVGLTDDNLNVATTDQSIAVNGVETFTPPTLTTPAPSSVIPGTSATFSWTPGDATTFQFRLGTKLGSNDIYGSGPTNATSETVSNLPQSGTIHARLYYMVGGALKALDYVYYTQAGMTSPAPGPLSGSTVTFTWHAGSATAFQLHLGTTPGAYDIYSSGQTTGTSETVTNLPTNGETIYARFYYLYNSVWQYIDYTYTAANQTALTTPTPGSTLSGSTVIFSWNPGSATTFQFRLGTTLGSNNLYGSGQTTKTSETVSGLPTNGSTIHARLYYMVSGAWQYNDYVYTAQ